MIRAYEKEVSWRAGGLAIAVHVALLGALLISFNWKAAHPVLNVAEVELWDSIPNVAIPPPPVVKPVIKEDPPPAPIVKEPPPPELVVKEEVKVEPKEEPKVDIELEKKKELEQKKAAKLAADKIKKEQLIEKNKQLAALQAEARKDEMRTNEKIVQEKKDKEALDKIRRDVLADEKIAGDQQALSAKAAVNAGIVDEFKGKIQAKIRGNVNKTLCGNGNPELKFDIGLLPTGELSGSPKLSKSSGSAACDEAVERAIMASEPLPLPSDASLFSQFRNLKLTFKPND
ncbi:MAG: cell envelope integrity protein TolA [Methylotenera sp.]|nr:cell envelope integrity protein TolA [Methylotenera sp.]